MISFFRVIKFSFQDIVRNIWLSLVTVTILVLALFSVNMLLVVDLISKTTVSAIKDKIDVSLYLKADAEESDILVLKAKISNLPDVKEIRYISKNEALNSFRSKYKNSPEIIQALRELGKNPLSPSLVIKPHDAENYQSLLNILNSLNDDIIEARNFSDHESILNKINSISERVNKAGLILSLIFISITILMVFNSIRMAIYTHRTEIAIMRLVGASNWFIRAPYLISSIVYALIGTLITIIAFYPFLNLLQPYLETFFVGYNVNIFSHFVDNFIPIFGYQLATACGINIIASLLAVGRYSKV